VNAAPLDAVRVVAAAVVGGVGLLLVVVGVLGLMRFGDFYSRTHAFSAACGPGASCVALGFVIVAPDLATGLKALVLAGAAALFAPVSAHLLASGAYGAGLQPAVGRADAAAKQESTAL
jgi:multicomponent Na+:H+ antiporter subunit G